jgi:cold-inducible RNA-binding protein
LESRFLSDLPFPTQFEVPDIKGEKKMTKKIYVGNLSFQTTENDLNDLFATFGSVESVSIITDRETGRSKGFGFVSMDEALAEKAISELNGREHSGRALTVNEARPMVRKDFSGRSNRGGNGSYR